MFDSWLGWLSTLFEFKKILPDYNYIYLWDSLRNPYWDKTPEEIFTYSVECCNYLFDSWVTVIIIACNTAMVHSIRKLQQEIFPNKKILWVTIPWAEKIVELGMKKIWVLGTSQTVKNMAYKERVHFIDNSINIQEVEAPLLVPLIEKWETHSKEFYIILKSYLEKFDNDIEWLILGCTHYSLIKSNIIKIIDKKIQIIDPSYESAIKFKKYLYKHEEIDKSLAKLWKLKVYTTWNQEVFKNIWSIYFDEIKKINIWKVII